MAQLWAEAHVTRSQNTLDEPIHALHLFLIVVVETVIETFQFVVFDTRTNALVCCYDIK